MANHSKKFNDVRSYYKYHMWKKRQVVNAVKQGWITEYEYEEITRRKLSRTERGRSGRGSRAGY